MEKAYNVYKIYGKTSIAAAFRKFTLLLAFGVCFLGFQTDATSQAQLTTNPYGATNGQAPDVNFLRTYDFSKTNEEAANILRGQKQLLMEAGEPDRGLAELDYGIKFQLLDASIMSLMNGVEIQPSLSAAFLKVSTVYGDGQGVDIQGVVESYARLLE